ncbi:PREDICTED: phosphatidylinositol-glycan biosynthesis class X protein-like [Priapulus caudatus]|uniref:Phosphatidylinositol-glycan biosynthesis class X protein n=1 Tax=Priapulus caudatus TaxID=37621 RepID=A0ABM1E895_PRICU|nr:PREDICTED: phosphatidylinositol-glycan biosynthesis class X protein-like [Priapulus caudatus]XP_014668415.1 PREDICTED: phosphatidylinositol-glycan biosynthesis class X protein-like [Priapulus caudatus]XP_014668416.1 PREDICTED: phosphatidylinositol-glycan biosynthesis class X protein-like [Priapulus caudatus]
MSWTLFLWHVLFHIYILIWQSALTIQSDVCLQAADADVYLDRYLNKAGFHRDLQTKVSVRGIDGKQQCRLLLIETIPSGVYVDLYQVAAMQTQGGPEVYSSQTIDVEAPEYLSTQHTLHVFANFNSSYTGELTADVTLPIHGRYHRADTLQFIEVVIKHPQLLIYCAKFGSLGCTGNNVVKAPCDSTSKSTCNWLPVLYKANKRNLSMFVPVGQVQHRTMVAVVTVCVTSMGCLLVLMVMWRKRCRRKLD